MSIKLPEPKANDGGVTSTTRSLLVGLKDHDEATWDRLIRLYTPLVRHWCQKHDLKPDDIPDVIQEVFKSVSENIERFRKERPQDTFRGWLRVITRNKAMDVHRRSGKEARGEGGTEAWRRIEAIAAPDPAAAESDEEDAEAHSILYQQALELIRNDFREQTWQAFWKVVVDCRPPNDVADEMGMSPGAVRVAKCRVLQKLRTELGDLLDE
ncbi:MAG: sigma-70 family RNA polymerase sigma factor [Verrucomicrobiota bacterium]